MQFISILPESEQSLNPSQKDCPSPAERGWGEAVAVNSNAMNTLYNSFNQKRPFYCFFIDILGSKNVNELTIRNSDFAKASSDEGRKTAFPANRIDLLLLSIDTSQ
jgi:hypothetical protein